MRGGAVGVMCEGRCAVRTHRRLPQTGCSPGTRCPQPLSPHCQKELETVQVRCTEQLRGGVHSRHNTHGPYSPVVCRAGLRRQLLQCDGLLSEGRRRVPSPASMCGHACCGCPHLEPTLIRAAATLPKSIRTSSREPSFTKRLPGCRGDNHTQ